MGLRDVAYGVYERRLAHDLHSRTHPENIPRHVAVMLDGNRRWAKGRGASPSHGHQRGADHIHDLLIWCQQAGVERVTLFMLSTDNLSRPENELGPLLEAIEGAVTDLAAEHETWRIHPVGALDLLPVQTSAVLKDAAAATSAKTGLHVNVAVGYGGRQEIADAVRSLLTAAAENGDSLTDVAASIDIEGIAGHLYTAGQPDPDLVIRTSGEQRLSGFLMWQSAHSEFYFCDALWPDFRHVDFLRALRSYAARHRRFGG